MNKRLFKKALVATIIISMISMLFSGCGLFSKSVSLNKYVTISSEGYDSCGTADYDFDYDAFEKDYGKKLKIKGGKSSDLSEWGITKAELFYQFVINCSLSQYSGLSNGDTITLEWNCDTEYADEVFGCKVKCSDISYKVDNLLPVDKFNPFDSVKVSFSGIAPEGKISFEQDYDVPEMQYIRFTADKSSGLSNGDSVVVSTELSTSLTSFVEQFGKVPSVSEQTYTVSGLTAYVTDAATIDAAAMEGMKKQGEDTFRAYVASDWDNPSSLTGVTNIGYYYLSAKPDSRYYDNNFIYLIYKIDVATESGTPFSYYYYVKYSNLVVDENGTVTVSLQEYEVPEYDTFWGWGVGEGFEYEELAYSGYQSLDDLKTALVISQIDTYQYTTNISE